MVRQTGVLWAYGVQVKFVDRTSGAVMFFWFCCAHDECVKMVDGELLPATVKIALGKEGKSHKTAMKHLFVLTMSKS